MYCPTIKSKNGFTLIELSIVIAIIGIIVGGIMAGRTLVRQASIRTVVSEANAYQTAINAFKLQYMALPGDFKNAFGVWGTACAATAGACNGNGNGLTWQTDVAGRQESLMAWKHLNLAGLVPGSYTGSTSLANNESTPGVNTPKSKMTGGEWWIDYSDIWYAQNTDSLLTQQQRLMIGAHRTNSFNEYQLFTPTEALSIDAKIDDGLPYGGQVMGIVGVGANCVSGNGITAAYLLTLTTPGCWMWIQIQ